MGTRIRIPAAGDGRIRIEHAFWLTIVWQLVASLVLAVLAGFFAGVDGFLSGVFGGSIGVVGVLVFALASGRRTERSGDAVRLAVRAEAAKVVVVAVLLWLAFIAYHDMVVLAFMGAFVVSVLLSGLAFAVSGDQLNSSRV
jgi:ATP synthase protein I